MWQVFVAAGAAALWNWACGGNDQQSRDIPIDGERPDYHPIDNGSDGNTDLEIPPRPDVNAEVHDQFVGDDMPDTELDALICGECDEGPDPLDAADEGDGCNCNAEDLEPPEAGEDNGCQCSEETQDIIQTEPVPDALPEPAEDVPQASEDLVQDNGSPDEGSNNCLDEGIRCYLGQGACRAEGVLVCKEDRTGTECNAVAGIPNPESCNGIDDDCDGLTDEDIYGYPLTKAMECGLGICAGGTRTATCTEADWVWGPCSTDHLREPDEPCDGKDHNCNGIVDDGCACTSGQTMLCGPQPAIGECRTGTTKCTDGTWGTDCTGAVYPSEEICDGRDNDCDGITDEDLTAPLADNQFGICRHSLKLCMGMSGWQNPDYTKLPGYEASDGSCNGTDNNCNGLNDEGYLPQVTYCGTGECASTGMSSCSSGSVAQNCFPKAPAAETCDGKDNNCDGATDEVTDPGRKRVLLNCYDDSHAPLNVADCWNWLTRTGQTAGSTVTYISTQFIDAATACNMNAGINLCISQAVTSCAGETITDGCVSQITFEKLWFGSQYAYRSSDMNVEFRIDRTTNPKTAAMQILRTPPGDPAGCTYLFNTFSCPTGCK